ncbi:hypothetical protein Peur_073312 [Populus x canadensis]
MQPLDIAIFFSLPFSCSLLRLLTGSHPTLASIYLPIRHNTVAAVLDNREAFLGLFSFWLIMFQVVASLISISFRIRKHSAKENLFVPEEGNGLRA